MRDFIIPPISINEYRYRIEMHAHTKPASKCGDILPEELVETYAAIGYDAVVLTNHIRTDYSAEQCLYHVEAYNRAAAAAVSYGMRIYYGMELSFADLVGDFLLYGVQPEDTENLRLLSLAGTQAFIDSPERKKSIVFHAHPYRNDRVGVDFQIPRLADGVESINLHPCVNSDNGFVTRDAHRAGILTICGTDYHHKNHEGMTAVLVKKLPETESDLRDLLTSGDYLFEVNGNVIIPSHRMLPIDK